MQIFKFTKKIYSVLALPAAKPIEKAELIGTRRRAQDIEFNLWREPDLKPVFTFTLRPRLIQAGIGVKLLCCLSGKPTPKVTWSKGGHEIDERNPHYLVSFNCGVCTLEIPACTVEDTGTYSCKAENPLGVDQTSCVLSVEECKYKERKPAALLAELGHHSRSTSTQPFERKRQSQPKEEKPKFIRKIPGFKTQSVGDSVNLKCQFTGIPTPQNQWFKNGEPLKTSSKITLKAFDDEASLTINNIEVSDEGEYSCKISNSQGFEICKCQLDVERPKPKEQPIKREERPIKKEEPAPTPAPRVIKPVAPEPIVEKPFVPEPVIDKKVLNETIESKLEALTQAIVKEEVAIAQPVIEESKLVKEIVEEPKHISEPPVFQETVESKSESLITEQISEPIVEPIAETVAEPVVESIIEPVVTEAVVEPVAEPVVEPVAEPITESIIASDEKVDETVIQPIVEPVVETVVEPVSDTSVESAVEEKVPAAPKPIFRFDTHLKSQNLLEGELMILECTVQGPEPLEVIWLRNGKEIPENPDFLKQRIDNLFRLTVNEIFPEDSGIFSAELFSETLNKAKLSSCSIIVQGN